MALDQHACGGLVEEVLLPREVCVRACAFLFSVLPGARAL
jgi:hypothetical protein